MVYNFNLGIGWASSGVEYAQVYRAKIFRSVGIKAKFVFTDMFPRENIQHMTENIGFFDEEVEWLYTFFTDTKIAPVTFTLKQLEDTFSEKKYTFSREGKVAKYIFPGNNNFYTVYMKNETEPYVHRVEMVSNGCLIRKDYYTYCRIFSEYYAPLDGNAYLYQRRFYNENGSVCYEEIIDGENVMYKFPNKVLFSKEELVGYMVSLLNLTQEDTVIIDRTTGIGQSIVQNAGQARLGIVVHADHFSANSTNEETILWNNYYEYAFGLHKYISFYVTATGAQKKLMEEQFKKYWNVEPNIVSIPVGSLEKLTYPESIRKPYSLITASRLASEKHVDWIIEAVVEAKKTLPQLSLDIYGRGGEEEKLKKLIKDNQAEDYIILRGQQNLTEVYKNYEGYLSGSTSEGFGLTLLEATGSGVPIIGFDVRYGNQTFIDHEQNGYIIPVYESMDQKERVSKMAEAVIRLFTEADLAAFHAHAYAKAEEYLTEKVENRWKELIG